MNRIASGSPPRAFRRWFRTQFCFRVKAGKQRWRCHKGDSASGVALLAESCGNVLLGESLRPGRHPSFLSQKGEVYEHLSAAVSAAEEQPLMAEDASAIIHVREDAPEHLALADGLGHVSIVNNHAGRMSGVLGVRAHGDIDRKFLVDVAENASPVNPVIGKDAIEHILTAAKQRLQGASAVIRGILDGKEREEDYQLDHMGTVNLQLRLFSKAICLSVMFMVPRTFIILCMPSPQPLSVKKLRDSETICQSLLMLGVYCC